MPHEFYRNEVPVADYKTQPCGHVFNAAGCRVCPACPRKPAVFTADSPWKPRAIVTRERIFKALNFRPSRMR